MKALCICVFIFSASCGVLAQVTLLQSGLGFLKPSETLRITCKASTSVNGYWFGWFRQPPGKRFEWLGNKHSGGSIEESPSLKSRVIISMETSKNEVYLQMLEMQITDSATYYCARLYGSSGGAFDYWGQGTLVTVTTVATQGPSLFPLISCGESPESVALGCLAKNFLPDAVSFSWTDKANSSFTSGLRKYPSVLSTDGMYTASTQVQVPYASWNNKDPYYCKVTHSALDHPLTKKLFFEELRLNKPTVTLHPPLKEDIILDNATIVCISRGFFPKLITMKWLKNGKEVTSGFRTEELPADKTGNFDATSWLDITSNEWNTNNLYSCEVDHPDSKFGETKNISKSMVCDATSTETGGVKVSVVPPTFQDMYENKSVKLTCKVTDMQGNEGLNISWSREDTKEELKTQITDPVLNDAGTFSALGIATICPEQWTEGYKFICKVQHPEMPSQAVVHLQKEMGYSGRAPVVHVYHPPAEELALKESATIVCLVKGYYPCDLFVKWLEDDKEIPKGSFLNTQSIKEEDPTTQQATCFMYSKLKVLESDWTAGRSYSCVVGHEALPFQVIQKSIDKSSGKPTSVNVSVVLSDAANTCS